ncbi:hypothetical protein DPMN_007018 [Dreissena polymorpha]|uniref:Uncharacterized protein n=1 Tax=Dreissena polymorpha TaxID=45954 RepID=A0A9D4MTJ0_DREPO|nr:hypothetical protein DPMN_007018 [Dreissena polymorpha]
MRICRRPYRGPRLPLEPHLVNSASSQEVSLERRELGNEADDELRPVHNKISPQPIRRQKRKQRPKVKRESWSLSDSELNDRRKRMTRQHLMIHNSSAAINHNNENQYFGDSDANGPVAENSEFSFATDSKHPLEMTLPIANQNNQTSHSEFGTPEKSMPSICLSTQTYKSGLINKSTTDSVDSNYMSFGVSRPHRSDLLSHISDFQKLFPSNEETGDSFGDTNMTENINNHNQNNEIHDCTPTDTDTDRSNMEHVIENSSTQISYNYADVMEEFFIDLNNEESGRSISSRDNAALFEDGSPLYDMLSSSKMSDITANAHVARYGDVISVISHNGSPMVFRIAGAGLQCGTVGENISFQVIKT